jgi:hypothetical protein
MMFALRTLSAAGCFLQLALVFVFFVFSQHCLRVISRPGVLSISQRAALPRYKNNNWHTVLQRSIAANCY